MICLYPAKSLILHGSAVWANLPVKALKLDPRSYGTQSRYGLLMASIGRLPEAIAAGLEATKIEPLDTGAWILLGWFYDSAGQFTPAHRALSHALQLSPQSTLAILLLAQNELATGKTAEAQKTNGGQQVEHWRWCIDVIIEHRLGHTHESQRILNELIEKYGQHSPIFIAITYAWRGEADSAFDWLERAYRRRDPPLGLIQFHGILSRLSSDPRYKSLLRKMNFPD
jgi:adenylate cyclase